MSKMVRGYTWEPPFRSEFPACLITNRQEKYKDNLCFVFLVMFFMVAFFMIAFLAKLLKIHRKTLSTESLLVKLQAYYKPAFFVNAFFTSEKSNWISKFLMNYADFNHRENSFANCL